MVHKELIEISLILVKLKEISDVIHSMYNVRNLIGKALEGERGRRAIMIIDLIIF